MRRKMSEEEKIEDYKRKDTDIKSKLANFKKMKKSKEGKKPDINEANITEEI